ncbi:MAG TPA: indolepyruvate oxidoreductase subunit beta [Spirochaetia bacterium]|nr:indolepyruvate oxidoreductase subunit beta [Spirochaetia bacterium]
MPKYDFILAGVGGQGTILASDILVEVGLKAGYDVKKSEVHGMSQRGGAVESHVRWGRKVYSPVVEQGRVDYLLGFEMLEGARWATYLNPRSKVYINTHKIYPPSVNIGQARYPEAKNIEQLLTGRAGFFEWVNATGKAMELGNQALAGVVVLGRLSRDLEVAVETWLEVIVDLVPAKFTELNKQAFAAGRELKEAFPA